MKVANGVVGCVIDMTMLFLCDGGPRRGKECQVLTSKVPSVFHHCSVFRYIRFFLSISRPSRLVVRLSLLSFLSFDSFQCKL